jgi:hypothetical protein
MKRSSSRSLLLGFLLAVTVMAAGTLTSTARPQPRKTPRKTKPTRSVAHTASYPKIRTAISSLEGARAELLRAESDFGGHRKDAIAAIDTALKQLRLALQFEKY